LEDLKNKFRELLRPYCCVAKSSLKDIYEQHFKSQLSPEDYISAGEFRLVRLLRKMPDVLMLAPATEPFPRGPIIIPVPPGIPSVPPPLPPDLRELVEMNGTRHDLILGDDEDPYYVTYMEDCAKKKLSDIVCQLRNELIQLARGHPRGLPVQQCLERSIQPFSSGHLDWAHWCWCNSSRFRYEALFQKKLPTSVLFGCKLVFLLQSVCAMASDGLCLRQGKLFFTLEGQVQAGAEAKAQTAERNRFKADFVQLLHRYVAVVKP
jgi:hypothetical protein